MAEIDAGLRLRAARELVGITSVQALAERVNTTGLGYKTLYAIEQGRRTPDPQELLLIADKIGVPIGFFTADLDTVLGDDSGGAMARRVAELERQVADQAKKLAAAAEHARDEEIEQLLEHRLAAMERALTEGGLMPSGEPGASEVELLADDLAAEAADTAPDSGEDDHDRRQAGR